MLKYVFPIVALLALAIRAANATTYKTFDYNNLPTTEPFDYNNLPTTEPLDNWDLVGAFDWSPYVNLPTTEPLDNWDLVGAFDWSPYVNQPEPWEPQNYQNQNWDYFMQPSSNPQQNIAAFLMMIRTGEGTADAGGYTRLMGGKQFVDTSNHPANLGWTGTKLSDAHCRAAGFGPGCVSTAAGAYQALSTTWNDFIQDVGPRDFSPLSQDEFALWALRRRGALADVEAGRFTDAVKKSAKEWASLPFSPYGQPTISLDRAKQIYASNGGTMIA